VTRHRWPAALPPDELGVVVHGPVLLARSPGIAAGLRCVYAHPGGLRLPLVLRAADVQADAAARTTSPRFRDDAGDREPWSGLTLDVEVDGIRGVADAANQESSGNADDFSLEGTYWIDRLPRDGRLRLTSRGRRPVWRRRRRSWPSTTWTASARASSVALNARVVPLL
jgi:hypothetical protein